MKHSNKEIIESLESILHELKMKNKAGKLLTIEYTVTAGVNDITTSSSQRPEFISNGRVEVNLNYQIEPK